MSAGPTREPWGLGVVGAGTVRGAIVVAVAGAAAASAAAEASASSGVAVTSLAALREAPVPDPADAALDAPVGAPATDVAEAFEPDARPRHAVNERARSAATTVKAAGRHRTRT